MTATEIRGHCACGALRYQIDVSNLSRDLQLSAYCHCSRCQRLNGAPYVWSTHWLYPALNWDPPAAGPPPGAPDVGRGGSSPQGHFSPNMQTYEMMKGRKWKLRCKECGSPIGSWNAAKAKWTIWPVTLERRVADDDDKEGVLAEGAFNVPDEVLAQIRPDHHQFYGSWRTVTVNDDLEKWAGYKGESVQVEASGTNV